MLPMREDLPRGFVDLERSFRELSDDAPESDEVDLSQAFPQGPSITWANLKAESEWCCSPRQVRARRRSFATPRRDGALLEITPSFFALSMSPMSSTGRSRSATLMTSSDGEARGTKDGSSWTPWTRRAYAALATSSEPSGSLRRRFVVRRTGFTY